MTDAAVIAFLYLLHFEIDIGPPADQIEGVVEDIGDFLCTGLDPPASDEVIIVTFLH